MRGADAAYARVRASRARRHARPGNRDPRLQRDAFAPAAAGCAQRELAVLVRAGLRLRERAISARALLSAARRAAGLPGPVRLRADDRRRRRRRRAGGLHVRLVGRRALHPRLGTIELRELDAQSRVEDAAAIAALVQALARHEAEHARAAGAAPRRSAESSFRASRDGIDGDDAARRRAATRARGRPPHARAVAGPRPSQAALDPIERMLAEGGGAARRRAAFERGGMDSACSTSCSARLQEPAMPDLILGPHAALRRRARRRRSGSRPTRRARSRCSAAASARSASRATTTRSCRSRASSRAAPSRTRSRSTASARWPRADDPFPPSAIRTIDPRRAAARSCSDRAASPCRTSRRTRYQGQGAARPRDRRALRARAAHDGAPARGVAGPPAVDRRPGLRGRGRARDARVHPLAARHEPSRRARRCSTSRSTRASTGSRGATPVIRWLFSTVGDDDDVRRPRRPRRLEHVDRLDRGDAGPADWWETRIEAPSPPTGSTSISATCRRPSSAESELLQAGPRGRRCGRVPARMGRQRRPRQQRQPLELLPRPRRRPHDHVRLARGPRGGRVAAQDERRRRVRVDLEQGDGRLRPSAARRHAAVPARARPSTTSRHGTRRSARGAWGGWAKGWGEKLRRGLDLEHWAAFNFSFRRLERVLTEVASGRRGRPPATIVGLGGDVHHAYLAEVGFPKGMGAESAVYQAVCSPFRNPLARHERDA